MPLEFWIHECVRDMLGGKDLHLDLRNYLDDIETYVGIRGGKIGSRQIAALALANYRERKELEKKIGQLEDRMLHTLTPLLSTILKRLTSEAGWNPDDEL